MNRPLRYLAAVPNPLAGRAKPAAVQFPIVDTVLQQTPVEPVPVNDSLKLFTSKTVLVTLGLWFFVGSVFGWLGFVVAGGYFGYQWRQVQKRKEQLAKATVAETVPRSGSGMTRESVRNALARKR